MSPLREGQGACLARMKNWNVWLYCLLYFFCSLQPVFTTYTGGGGGGERKTKKSCFLLHTPLSCLKKTKNKQKKPAYSFPLFKRENLKWFVFVGPKASNMAKCAKLRQVLQSTLSFCNLLYTSVHFCYLWPFYRTSHFSTWKIQVQQNWF